MSSSSSSSSSPTACECERKIVVITGGTRGIGRGIVDAFARASPGPRRIYVIARDITIVDDGMRADERIVYVRSDLSTALGAQRVKEEIERRDGERGVNVLVHNSGTSWGAPMETHEDEGWRKTYELNVIGVFRLTRELLGALVKASTPEDPSRIIIVGSIAGVAPQTYPTFSYDASKAALHHLAKKLADEFASKRKLNITVNVVAPGYVPTKMSKQLSKYGDSADDIVKNVPLGRAGTPEDVAGAVLFFASSASSWITGVVLPVDGGFLAKL